MPVTSWGIASEGKGYIDFTNPSTVIAREPSITLPLPTVKLKFDNAYNPSIKAPVYLGYSNEYTWANGWYPKLYFGSTLIGGWGAQTSSSVGDNTYGVATWTHSARNINTSILFNANNKTSKTVTLQLKAASKTLIAWSNSSFASIAQNDSEKIIGSFTVTLDAPPTFIATTTSIGPYYQQLSTYSVSISDVSAKYEGNISKTELTIGNQTVSGTGDGSLSLVLQQEGDFTPTISVTDSRGQTSTETLDPITVVQYSFPKISFAAERTRSLGEPDDEGTYAVINAQIEYSDVTANLTEPLLEVNGEPHLATWYKTRSSDGTLSDMVDWNDTSSFSSPKTLYGLLGTFHTEESYVISITPRDNYSSGLEISQTLSQAFYTVDFLAGGHGIAFGKPASINNLFDVGLPALFRQDVTAQTWAGFIQMFAGATAPSGWLFCDGSEVAVADYPLLHAVIGNTYGTPSDSDHFLLPDLNNRFPVGAGAAYALNDKGGSEYIQEHSHSFTQPTVDNGGGTNNITGGSHHHATYRKKNAGSGSAIYVPDGGSTANGISTTDTTHTHSLPNHTHRVQGGAVNAVKDVPAGDGGNLPPYIGINFIICTGEIQ